MRKDEEKDEEKGSLSGQRKYWNTKLGIQNLEYKT